MTPEDFADTLSAQAGCNALRDKVALLLTYMLGLRAKETAALTIKDVWDYKKGEPKKVIRLLAAMTKGKKFREVYLIDHELRSCITELIGSRVHNRDAPVIQSQKGGPFTPDTMQKMLKRRYAKARIHATSHSGRRSFATNLIRSNADIYSVMTMMGHTSIATTQVYFASDPTRLMEQVERMGREVRVQQSKGNE